MVYTPPDTSPPRSGALTQRICPPVPALRREGVLTLWSVRGAVGARRADGRSGEKRVAVTHFTPSDAAERRSAETLRLPQSCQPATSPALIQPHTVEKPTCGLLLCGWDGNAGGFPQTRPSSAAPPNGELQLH